LINLIFKVDNKRDKVANSKHLDYSEGSLNIQD